MKLEANEILGDTRVLREQIEKAQQEAQNSESNDLEAKLTHLEYAIHQLIEKIESFTRKTEN